MLQLVAKILLHLIWVVPLFYGKIFFAMAAVLGVAIFYVKTLKLAASAQELEAKGLGASTECVSFKKHSNRWRQWTFLSKEAGDVS